MTPGRPPMAEHTWRQSYELGRANRMAHLREDGIQRCRACDGWTDAPICRRCSTSCYPPLDFGVLR